MMLVNHGAQHPDSPLWKYNQTVGGELERRSESSLRRALKLAHDP